MRSHSLSPLQSWRGAIYSSLVLSALLLTTPAAHAEINGSLPPSLIFAPTVGTTINFTGVTSAGSNGSAQISVTPSGGSGSGATATTNLSCTFTGNAAGNFSVNPSNSNFLPGGSTTNLALSCVSGSTVRTATLSCSESPSGATAVIRNWPVNCPAGTLDVPPNLAYLPTAGSPVVFASTNPIIGGSANAQIRVTPSGGSGSGLLATSKLGQCSVSNETVPGTFGGFQNVTLTFVGSTTIPQNLNLTAVLRGTPVTGTLTCTESIGDSGGPGANATITTRSWPLQSAAGQSPARLSISKTASASSVVGDTDFNYTVTVSNDGDSAQTGIVILDDVPAALSVQSASGAGWNCSVVGNAVDCRRNSLGASSSSSVDIAVRAPNTAQTIVNTARATSVELRSPVTSTASVTVLPPTARTVDLRLDKRDSADPVLVNAFFTYTLEVQNIGEHPATGVAITDTLPAGVALNTASGSGWTCSGTSAISCALTGPLAAGASSIVSVVVRAPNITTNLSNTAQVSSTEVDSNPANNSDTEATRIDDAPTPPVPQADVAVSAVAVPATALTGQPVEFRVTVLNRGPDPARGVFVNGIISSAITSISASGSGWTCTPNQQTVFCTRAGNLNANQSADLVVRGTLAPGATAAASGDFGVSDTGPIDPDTSNNQARVTISYQPGGADLAISMTDSADPVGAGAEFGYNINVSNAGPEAAAGVRVSDTLPAALTFVSASGAGYTCTRAGQIVTCTLGSSLASGASAPFVIRVRAPTTGQTINNQASVGATTTDPNAANNNATQSTRVNDRTAEDLNALLSPSATDPVSRAALPVVAAECVRPNTALTATCNAIVSAAEQGRNGEVGDALRAIAPDEVLAQSLVLREIGATQFFNVDARLNELRRGGGGFSLSGLTVNYGNQSIPVALAGDALRAALGFGDSGDGLISPWGFFINGSIGTGDQDLDFGRSRVGVGYDSKGITAGVDYRFSTRLVAGAAVGYASYAADVNSGSQLDSKSLIFTGYGSYYLSDRLYVDSRLSYGSASLDQERLIRFQLGSTLFDALAQGSTDASQLTVASSMGYHLNYGAWSVTPSVGLRFTSTDVDAFEETGANAFNVAYDKQSFDSVQFAAGFQVARALSLSHGVLMPNFDLSFNSENGDDPSAEARLVSGSTTELFRLQEQNPDSSYGTAGLGFVYLMGNGRQAYLSYRHTFGYDSFDRGTLNLGGRFEF